MEWDFLIPNRSVEVHRTRSPSLAFIEVGDIITTELRLLMSLPRCSVVTCLLTLHRKGTAADLRHTTHAFEATRPPVKRFSLNPSRTTSFLKSDYRAFKREDCVSLVGRGVVM
jgi:hypothetical protein